MTNSWVCSVPSQHPEVTIDIKGLNGDQNTQPEPLSLS